MNAVYEYLVAGLMMFIMLASLQTAMQYLVSDKAAMILQQQYSVAGSVLDMILVSPGDPPNWSVSDPILFGLASQETTDMYNLNAKKVLRLDSEYPEYPYLSPGKLRSLLGMNPGYNIIIRINPVFPISIQLEGDGLYRIGVADHKGLPLANVNITGFYVHESQGSTYKYFLGKNITMIDGECTLKFDTKPNYGLIVCADLLGIKTMQTFPEYMKYRIEGNQVIKNDVPLVTSINYTSGSFYGQNTDQAAKYVTIDGFTYYFELEIWR